MIPRIRRVLISLAFAPCVSAAPTVQQSDLPLVESFPAPCNFGLNQIRRALCALVHSIPEIADEAILFSPAYTVNWIDCTTGACIERNDEESPVRATLQTLSNTAIIRHNTQPRGHSPESQLSVNVGGSVINLVFLPTDCRDSVDVNDGCSHHSTWQLLEACSETLVGSMEIVAAPDELLRKGEALHKRQTKSKGDEIIHKSIETIKSGEEDGSKTKNKKMQQEDRYIGDDIRDRTNDDGDEGVIPEDAEPIDEELEEDERKLLPPVDHNFWSLTFITSSMLIVAAVVIYVRWRRLVRSYRKPHRFHVGEAVLLRWASEDMIFDDEELDTMAKQSEEIPLNPGPTKGFVIHYGSSA